jgi:hypothetical protein
MNDFESIEVKVKTPPPPIEQSTEIDLGEDKSAPAKVEKEELEPVKEERGADILQRQLDEKRREIDEARRQKMETEQMLRQREQEVYEYQNQAQSSQHVALVNAMASYERDAEALEREYANSMSEGDYHKAAKTQRQMAQVEARLMTLQQGKDELETRLQQPRQEPKMEQPRIQPVASDSIDDKIKHLHPSSQAWIKSHPETLNDPKMNNKMTAAHYKALAEDYTPNTNDYFAFIDSEMGYNKPQATTSSRSNANKGGITSAPVSRSQQSSFSSANSTNVLLSPSEREYARDMDMTDEEYAEAKLFYINRGDLRG